MQVSEFIEFLFDQFLIYYVCKGTLENSIYWIAREKTTINLLVEEVSQENSIGHENQSEEINQLRRIVLITLWGK